MFGASDNAFREMKKLKEETYHRLISSTQVPGVLEQQLRAEIDVMTGGVRRFTRVDACAQAKCAYCGRYGALGQCAGCGAPNQPVSL